MATRISQGAAYAAMDAIRTLIANGTIRIRSGAQPATASDAETGTVLATITSVAVAAVAFSSNYAQFTLTGTITDASADATGTAGWFRWSDAADAGAASTGSGGEPRIDGSVTATGGGGDMELSSTAIVAGNPVNITSLVIRIPMY